MAHLSDFHDFGICCQGHHSGLLFYTCYRYLALISKIFAKSFNAIYVTITLHLGVDGRIFIWSNLNKINK